MRILSSAYRLPLGRNILSFPKIAELWKDSICFSFIACSYSFVLENKFCWSDESIGMIIIQPTGNIISSRNLGRELDGRVIFSKSTKLSYNSSQNCSNACSGCSSSLLQAIIAALFHLWISLRQYQSGCCYL